MVPAESEAGVRGDVQRYLEGAASNLGFADWLKSTGRDDPTTVGWAITAAFYAAVHAVRAYLLARHGVRVGAHTDMPGLQAQHPELNNTARDYNMLKQESQSARYYLNQRFTWADFDKLRAKAARVQATWRPKTEQALQPPPGSPESPGSGR
ncbi:MAG: hypothetical protein HY744_13015 [Deltaproteobacteria bacterium]|nr:hypothetical protein [Deltaproteobacteria bacterium]